MQLVQKKGELLHYLHGVIHCIQVVFIPYRAGVYTGQVLWHALLYSK